jgi:hypothetical protein
MITIEQLRTELRYDPVSGLFTRLVKFKNVRVVDIAGSVQDNGYVRVMVRRELYAAHRLAWFYMTGAWPAVQIDHMNGVRTDNRWSNLREATSSMNKENQRRARRDNKTGWLGVDLDGDKYRAQIQVKGRKIFLGHFGTPDEAHQAYVKAKRLVHQGNTL